MVMVETQPQDDTTLIEYVEAVVGQIASLKPPGIYITRIDGWFGQRWLGFSGKTLGLAGVHRREDFDIPPFVPNRVVATTFLKSASDSYEPAAPPRELHITQRSEANLRRKIEALVPSDALVWFSSESHREGRGSILAYVPSDEGKHEAWFLELVRNGEWRVAKSIGTSPKELPAARRAELNSCTGREPLLYCAPRASLHRVAVRAGELQAVGRRDHRQACEPSYWCTRLRTQS